MYVSLHKKTQSRALPFAVTAQNYYLKATGRIIYHRFELR